ncbi:MAG: hypothetical protein QNJ37_10315 [Crocosphaera sp.]|nr:hypothetical protein [Crocosphaera sp.]
MFDYGNTQHDDHVSPDALLEITNPANPSHKDRINAIVDSGSVITCLPKSTIDNLGGLEYKIVQATTADGKSVYLRKYTVHITVTNNDTSNLYRHEVGEICVLSIPNKKYALIGRDIINNHKVVLDAPEEKWGLECIKYCKNQK